MDESFLGGAGASDTVDYSGNFTVLSSNYGADQAGDVDSDYALGINAGASLGVAAAVLAAGTGLFLLFPWVAGNADPSATGRRTLRLAADDPYHWHGDRPRALDLATVLAERGHAQAARVLLEKVARRRPEIAVARADLGILLWNEGDYAGAREHLAAAVEPDPSLDPPLYYLGASLFHLREGDRGESRFREFLRQIFAWLKRITR